MGKLEEELDLTMYPHVWGLATTLYVPYSGLPERYKQHFWPRSYSSITIDYNDLEQDHTEPEEPGKINVLIG